MEAKSGSHLSRTIALSAHTIPQKAPVVATQLSLALQQVLCFHLW